MTELSAATVRRLMRANCETTRGLGTRWNLTLTRVRQMRHQDVKGEAFVRDWLEMLTAD